MIHFGSKRSCHICKSKFAMLRRACHCRNCGVCICKDCAVQWPSRMIPDTYNTKKENVVNVCKSCNWLSNSFRLALLHGDHDRAVSLHATGNVNMHTPFANVKGELFFPVHCAVLGRNLDLLKFLVDENCCPIKSNRAAGAGKFNADKFPPLVTSKGRSLLGIAMENEDLPIIRYLVAQKGIMLSADRCITPYTLCRNLEKLLRFISADAFVESRETDSVNPSSEAWEHEDMHRPINAGDLDGIEPLTPDQIECNDTDSELALSNEARSFGAVKIHKKEVRRSSSHDVSDSVHEECK